MTDAKAAAYCAKVVQLARVFILVNVVVDVIDARSPVTESRTEVQPFWTNAYEATDAMEQKIVDGCIKVEALVWDAAPPAATAQTAPAPPQPTQTPTRRPDVIYVPDAARKWSRRCCRWPRSPRTILSTTWAAATAAFR